MSNEKDDRKKKPRSRVPRGVDPLGFCENPPPEGLVKSKRSAVVIGAGITGLTAAHELVERGFDVTVYEAAEDPGRPGHAGVGGQAASQWTRTEFAEFLTGTMRRAPAVVRPAIVDGPTDGDIGKFAERVKNAVEGLPTPPTLHIRVTAFYDDPEQGLIDADELALGVRAALQGKLGDVDAQITPHVVELPPPEVRTDYEGELARKTALTLDQVFLPGEHGFRFFPAFYHHLFDTMRRTPILDKDWKLTGRTTADALVPTTLQAVALEDADAELVFRRERPETPSGWVRLLNGLVGGLRLTLRDVASCNLKLFQYMTSCTRRREHYECMSWWDFLGGDRYSPEFQRQLEAVPQALVGMRATESDARTQGNATVQLLLDQFRHGERTDRTLDAPTSCAWLDHWRRYLESQGVKFELVALDKLAFVGGKLEVKVRTRGQTNAVQLAAPSGATEIASPLYVVFATPLSVLQTSFGAGHEGNPTLRRMVEFPKDAFSAMSGIQYYFESDLELLRGHCYYPDSPWRLSSISQAQFWRHRYRLPPGIRGVVSVDVGAFDVIAPRTGKPAARSSVDEFAEEVWNQVLDAFDPGFVKNVPRPVRYHIDDAIVDTRTTPATIVADPKQRAPFLMARPGEWHLRPGELKDYAFHRGVDPIHKGVGYEVIEGLGQLYIVLAGVYMKTHTRLTTMEAANESGRRAVNAILEHAGLQAVPCQLFDFERMELEDTALEDYVVLKKLDELLVERGLPHFVEILGLDCVPDPLLPGAHRSAGHHAHVHELIATLARAAGLGDQFMRDLAREAGARL